MCLFPRIIFFSSLLVPRPKNWLWILIEGRSWTFLFRFDCIISVKYIKRVPPGKVRNVRRTGFEGIECDTNEKKIGIYKSWIQNILSSDLIRFTGWPRGVVGVELFGVRAVIECIVLLLFILNDTEYFFFAVRFFTMCKSYDRWKKTKIGGTWDGRYYYYCHGGARVDFCDINFNKKITEPDLSSHNLRLYSSLRTRRCCT